MINKFFFLTLWSVVILNILKASDFSDKNNSSLIPKPNNIKFKNGDFKITDKTVIYIYKSLDVIGNYFINQIESKIGIKITRSESNNSKRNNIIVFELENIQDESSAESYSIFVGKNNIELKSKSEVGIFRGIHTLLQLFPIQNTKKDKKIYSNKIPCCEINDNPRFSWRGLNLDCGRHFMTKDFIKRYIDILAHYKFNIFHWHLTEDQGWRIEIKKYPKLTQIGAWRKEADGSIYGGFYSQEDIKEIVEYAKSRFITIVPEIEMPGHCLASLASYPENSCTGGPFEVGTQWGVMKDVYCAGNESTYNFLKNVLSEVVDLFPGKYIHIGGDEAPKDRWNKCPRCQEKIKAKGLKNERELQTYFIKRISDFLTSKGKSIIGWDEILEGGLIPGATVQSWQSFNGAIEAAKLGHYSICSPASHTYLNSDAENLSMQTCYSFDPVPENLTEDETKFILGSEANLWTEHAPQETVDSKLFPRVLALSEVFWTNKSNKDYSDFYSRVQKHYEKLIADNIFYGRESKAIIYSTIFDNKNNKFKVTLKPGQNNLHIYYTVDGSTPDLKSSKYSKPVVITKSNTLKAAAFLQDRFIGNMLNLGFVFHKAHNSLISLKSPFNEQYSGGGINGLIDGIRGTNNFRDGQWQGYEGVDFDAIIDLKEEKEISKISLGCLQNTPSWIFFPTKVDFFVSNDNTNYINIGTSTNDISAKSTDILLKDFSMTFEKKKIRYIKIIANNLGICPPWHPGAGGKSWIFVDEIIIE